VTAAVARFVPAARDALWAHPEWWLVSLGIAGWIATLRTGLAQAGHQQHHRADVAADLGMWLVMVTAMMLPVIVFQAREVAFRSFAGRRHRAIAVFFAGYLAPWAAFAVAAAALRPLPWSHSPWTVAALCVAAAAWAATPVRNRAMTVLYGFTPAIAPDGWQATRDCGAAGVTVGSWCVVSCWPLMLACAFSGHDLAIVTAGGAIALIESRSFRPPVKLVVAVCFGLALFAVL
jgi:predicted metal-binding membrane protein